MPKTTLYIVRHGQTEWNVEKRMQGRKDSPLTELGEWQARWLSEALAPIKFDEIYSSSSGRAVKTAEIISGKPKDQIKVTDQLKEMHLGVWEGEIQATIQENDQKRFSSFWNDPEQFEANGGESFIDVQKRVLPELQRIITNHTGKNILIVTHTVIIKILMAYFEERPLSKLWDPPYIHPACLCKVELEEGKHRICLHGDISHYKHEAVGLY
ncbi:histidine phosphatase family protein [Fictibacillus sp. Mic-4]|uniref:histidine phosphatase family protein n=1 Tax=Fictibacillus sp. Mic-4 TaxID=3132826 RepID=UPI003CE9427F